MRISTFHAKSVLVGSKAGKVAIEGSIEKNMGRHTQGQFYFSNEILLFFILKHHLALLLQALSEFPNFWTQVIILL